MKLRIITSMLLVVFLSVFNSLTASAHEGCKGDNCCKAYTHGHHGFWGHHHGYYYGPDGYYAKHKGACCDKGEGKMCDKSSCNKSCDKSSCGKSSCGKSSCASNCSHTYTRAKYHEDCCGRAHLHTVSDNDD